MKMQRGRGKKSMQGWGGGLEVNKSLKKGDLLQISFVCIYTLGN